MALPSGGLGWVIFFLFMRLAQKTVVEYSPSPKCIHIHTVDEMLLNNRRVVMAKEISDYIAIGIFNNYEEAIKFLKPVYKFLNQREINY